MVQTTSLFVEQSVGPEIQQLIASTQRDLAHLGQKIETVSSKVPHKTSRPKKLDENEHYDCALTYFKLELGTLSNTFKTALHVRTEVCFLPFSFISYFVTYLFLFTISHYSFSPP